MKVDLNSIKQERRRQQDLRNRVEKVRQNSIHYHENDPQMINHQDFSALQEKTTDREKQAFDSFSPPPQTLSHQDDSLTISGVKVTSDHISTTALAKNAPKINQETVHQNGQHQSFSSKYQQQFGSNLGAKSFQEKPSDKPVDLTSAGNNCVSYTETTLQMGGGPNQNYPQDCSTILDQNRMNGLKCEESGLQQNLEKSNHLALSSGGNDSSMQLLNRIQSIREDLGQMSKRHQIQQQSNEILHSLKSHRSNHQQTAPQTHQNHYHYEDFNNNGPAQNSKNKPANNDHQTGGSLSPHSREMYSQNNMMTASSAERSSQQHQQPNNQYKRRGGDIHANQTDASLAQKIERKNSRQQIQNELYGECAHQLDDPSQTVNSGGGEQMSYHQKHATFQPIANSLRNQTNQGYGDDEQQQYQGGTIGTGTVTSGFESGPNRSQTLSNAKQYEKGAVEESGRGNTIPQNVLQVRAESLKNGGMTEAYSSGTQKFGQTRLSGGKFESQALTPQSLTNAAAREQSPTTFSNEKAHQQHFFSYQNRQQMVQNYQDGDAIDDNRLETHHFLAQQKPPLTQVASVELNPVILKDTLDYSNSVSPVSHPNPNIKVQNEVDIDDESHQFKVYQRQQKSQLVDAHRLSIGDCIPTATASIYADQKVTKFGQRSNSLQDNRSKSKKRKSSLPPFLASQNANNELFALDTYYTDLIAKERQTFERILQSKLNVQAREIERKMHKQVKEAEKKLEKAEQLHVRFSESQAHQKRLLNNLSEAKKAKNVKQKSIALLKQENESMRHQLNEVWLRQEVSINHAKLTAKVESDQSHSIQIQNLVHKIGELEHELEASKSQSAQHQYMNNSQCTDCCRNNSQQHCQSQSQSQSVVTAGQQQILTTSPKPYQNNYHTDEPQFGPNSTENNGAEVQNQTTLGPPQSTQSLNDYAENHPTVTHQHTNSQSQQNSRDSTQKMLMSGTGGFGQSENSKLRHVKEVEKHYNSQIQRTSGSALTVDDQKLNSRNSREGSASSTNRRQQDRGAKNKTSRNDGSGSLGRKQNGQNNFKIRPHSTNEDLKHLGQISTTAAQKGNFDSNMAKTHQTEDKQHESVKKALQNVQDVEFKLLETENQRLKSRLTTLESRLEFSEEHQNKIDDLRDLNQKLDTENGKLKDDMRKLKKRAQEKCVGCESWKMKANLLTSKYFSTLNSLKGELAQLKVDTNEKIVRGKKEIKSDLSSQLKLSLMKIQRKDDLLRDELSQVAIQNERERSRSSEAAFAGPLSSHQNIIYSDFGGVQQNYQNEATGLSIQSKNNQSDSIKVPRFGQQITSSQKQTYNGEFNSQNDGCNDVVLVSIDKHHSPHNYHNPSSSQLPKKNQNDGDYRLQNNGRRFNSNAINSCTPLSSDEGGNIQQYLEERKGEENSSDQQFATKTYEGNRATVVTVSNKNHPYSHHIVQQNSSSQQNNVQNREMENNYERSDVSPPYVETSDRNLDEEKDNQHLRRTFTYEHIDLSARTESPLLPHRNQASSTINLVEKAAPPMNNQKQQMYEQGSIDVAVKKQAKRNSSTLAQVENFSLKPSAKGKRQAIEAAASGTRQTQHKRREYHPIRMPPAQKAIQEENTSKERRNRKVRARSALRKHEQLASMVNKTHLQTSSQPSNLNRSSMSAQQYHNRNDNKIPANQIHARTALHLKPLRQQSNNATSSANVVPSIQIKKHQSNAGNSANYSADTTAVGTTTTGGNNTQTNNLTGLQLTAGSHLQNARESTATSINLQQHNRTQNSANDDTTTTVTTNNQAAQNNVNNLTVSLRKPLITSTQNQKSQQQNCQESAAKELEEERRVGYFQGQSGINLSLDQGGNKQGNGINLYQKQNMDQNRHHNANMEEQAAIDYKNFLGEF